MAVESRRDLASCHGSIVRIASGALLVLSLRQSYLHQNRGWNGQVYRQFGLHPTKASDQNAPS